MPVNFFPRPEKQSHLSRSIALMTAASLLIPLVDASAKYLSGNISPFFLAWDRFIIATIVFSIFCRVQRGELIQSRDVSAIAIAALRGLALVVAMTLVFWALKTVPLTTALGGYFVGPVIAVILAKYCLGETIKGITGISSIIGVTGAFLVLQPSISFNHGDLLAGLSGQAFGIYLVATRLGSRKLTSLDTTLITLLTGSVILTPFAFSSWPQISLFQLCILLEMGILTAVCQYMVILALSTAPTAVVAPLAYSELVSATILGYLIFGDVPGLLSSLGLLAIIISGIIVARYTSHT